MDFINTDGSDFLGLDLGCELNKEEIQGEIAKLSELFLNLVIEMRQKSEDQAKVLDDQDLEILDARFALDRIKTEYEFATQEQMKLTCTLNELQMTELELKTEIIRSNEQMVLQDEVNELQTQELQSITTEIEQATAYNSTFAEKIVREQAKMETLILEQKAKQRALELKLIKVELAEERLRKYEDLIGFLDGEIEHFKAETDDKLNAEFQSLCAQNEELKQEYENVGAEIKELDQQIESYQLYLPQLEQKNEQLIELVNVQVNKQIDLKSIKEGCLAEIERQKELQREVKRLKQRKLKAIANVALWEERNTKLSKKVDEYVQKERYKIRNMIVAAESSKPKKVLKTQNSYGSLATKSTAIGSTKHKKPLKRSKPKGRFVTEETPQSSATTKASDRSVQFVETEFQKSKDQVLEAILLIEQF